MDATPPSTSIIILYSGAGFTFGNEIRIYIYINKYIYIYIYNIIPHTRSEARYFSDYNCYPIRNFGGGDWLEGCHFERMKIQWSGSLVSRTKYVMMTLEW